MNHSKDQPIPPTPFNAWVVINILSQRWLSLTIATIAFAVLGAVLAFFTWGRSYTSAAQLVHYEPSSIDDTYHPRALVTPSLVVMLQSPGLLAEVGSHLVPPVAPEELARQIQIVLDRNNDVVTVTASGPTREQSIDLVNRYCAAAIAYTQAMQRLEATEAGDNVARQLALVESEIVSARAVPPSDHVATVNAPVTEVDSALVRDLPQRIQTTRDQLDDLLVRYTEAHPLVREQRARLAALEETQRRIAATNPPLDSHQVVTPVSSPSLYARITPQEIAMGERLRSLESNRAILITREHAIQPFRDNPPGYFRVLSSATANPTFQYNHRLEVVLCACLGAWFGLFGATIVVLLREFLDNHIKTRADVLRVTGLPLLAAVGDLTRLSAAERDQSALRAWTAVRSRLRPNGLNQGLLCGITSGRHGDGRSSWIDLLARAAVQSGFRVLTIAPESRRAGAGQQAAKTELISPDASPASLGVLAAPGLVVGQLTGTDSPARINVSFSSGPWDRARRQEWQTALQMWSAVEHVVIFVELPPASASETLLLAENIPNLLWVVNGSDSDAEETRAELETLRFAGCHLVGAVLNRERAAPMQERYSRWLGTAMAMLLVRVALPHPKASAAEVVDTQASEPSAAFSVVDPQQRAPWQRRLTLGPGDVLSFQLYGSPGLTREDVPVSPDGRVSYLEAENIVATGLTVDELRDRVNEELGKFRRTPQASIIPLSYHSQRYYLLGSVVQRGVFPLDRPITIIEAVARAHGFETSVNRGNVVETTDFAHSFIARGGHRLPIDFEKLFLRGDLSQNVALEPDDYLYFPAAAAGAIYVLGEVRMPGAVAFDSDTNVLTAITSRGGFTERAWKQRVLVVRNSLNQPEVFRVSAYGALEGKGTNLELQPGDVVYVSNRPWIRAEELLDRAASAFVESAVITWTSIHVGAGAATATATLGGP